MMHEEDVACKLDLLLTFIGKAFSNNSTSLDFLKGPKSDPLLRMSLYATLLEANE